MNAQCHPDREHHAREMCKPCYKKWLYKANGLHRARLLYKQKEWRTKAYLRLRNVGSWLGGGGRF